MIERSGRSRGHLVVFLLAVGLGPWGAACSPEPDRAPVPASDAGTPRVTPALEGGERDRFRDVTAEAGLDFVHVLVDGRMSNIGESLGSGAAFLDHDGDGLLDLYLVQSGWASGVVDADPPREPSGNRLYGNVGQGRFRDVTAAAGVGDTGFGLAAVAADYDGDGRTDLYVCNLGPNRLYRNRGGGSFEDASERAGVTEARFSAGASFFDYDGDSDLDLYVANYLEFDPDYPYHYAPDVFPPPLAYEAQPDALFENLGNGTFEDVSVEAGIRAAAGRGMSAVTADFDGDGRTDVFVANDASANFLWHNSGDGTFEEVAFASGLAYGANGDATAAMTADWGDCNGDGAFDLVVTDISYGSLYVGVGPGVFSDLVFASGIGRLSGQYVSWGGGFLDFDADADLDLLIVNGDLHHMVGWEDLLLRNDGAGRFSDAAAEAAYFRHKLMGRGGAIADYDNDGDLDVLVTNLADRPVLLRNETPEGSDWLSVRLEGMGQNTAGYGARVEVRVGDRIQVDEVRCPSSYLCCGDPRLHFGLGTCERIDRIEVTWPSGRTSVLQDVPSGQHLVIREGAE